MSERDLQWSIARTIARSIPGMPDETYLGAALAVHSDVPAARTRISEC